MNAPNPPLRVLIVDDEAPARHRLRDVLADCADQLAVEVVGEAGSGLEALAQVQNQPVDAVLLDIRMPGMDGLECAAHLNRLAPPPAIIFSTAYDAYACQAFDLNAVDYLLKPVRADRLVRALSRAHRPERGRRDVYVVVTKRASEDREQVHMLRMQKWDMTFRLDHGKSPETAMFETEEYTEYTQDRYLGCRRLGMNLFGPIRIGKISELYHGTQKKLDGTPIWTPYFEREYVRGIASDKLTKDHWSRPGYAERFAQLLGQAAASNIIVGRGDGRTEGIADEDLIVFFDDGDEVVVERDDMIESLVVMHHTGSFWHFHQPLCRLAAAYARPVMQRWDKLPDPAAFARIYLDAMIDRFADIQREYREDRHAFEHLFHLRQPRSEGNFAHRWQCVLKRLEETDPAALKEAIAARLRRTAG